MDEELSEEKIKLMSELTKIISQYCYKNRFSCREVVGYLAATLITFAESADCPKKALEDILERTMGSYRK